MTLLALCAWLTQTHSDELPLRLRIDAVIAADLAGPFPPLCTDADFLRRVSLDLTGTIPTAAEARAFLDDADPAKREKLVDRLLADPAHARNMAVVLDVMLLERRGNKYVTARAWRDYLEKSVAANKPWNELAAEILGSDGTDPALHAAARFVLDRDAEANLVTRDVARMFFGMDVQCAQCHDHPLVDDFLQADYYGLLAFVGRSGVFQPDKKKAALLSETAPVSVGFKSVFTDEAGLTLPRLPNEPQIDEPYFPPGDEYATAPAKNVRSIPKFSRRSRLAALVRTGENPQFQRNAVNRLWAHLLGRGIVHPVDMLHSDNPPSHPELLDLLSEDFAASGFDIRRFLREVVLSETYQRSFVPPADLAENAAAARERLPQLKSRRAALASDADKSDEAVDAAEAKLAEARESLNAPREALGMANAAVTATMKPLTDAKNATAAKQNEVKAKQAMAMTVEEAAKKAEEVAKALPKDAEVVKAAAVLRDRAGKTAKEVASLTKQAQELAGKIKPLQDAYDQAAKSAREVAAKLEEARGPRKVAEAEWTAARRAAEFAATRLNDLDATIERLQTLIAWDDARTELASLVVEKRKVDADHAEATSAARRLVALSNSVAERDRAVSEANRTYNATTARFEAHTSAVSLMDESLAQAEVALSKLPKDEGLARAIADVRARTENLRSRTTVIKDEVETLSQALEAAEASRDEAIGLLVKNKAILAPLAAKLTELISAREQLADRIGKLNGAVDESMAAVTESWTHRFVVANADPLSPEQLGRAVLRATGQVERQRAAAKAEVDKKSPLTEADAKDPTKVDLYETRLRDAEKAKVDALLSKFVSLFGSSAGQPQDEFFATVDQALFFANGGEVRGWLNPSGENLTARLVKVEDPVAIAEELYLSILTRRPTTTEIEDVRAFLADRTKDRSAAVVEMAWALMTSIEFRFNH